MPTPIRVLVIEDDVMVAFAVVAILQEEGWIVVGPIGRLHPAIEASGRVQGGVGIMGSFHSASVRSEVR